MMQKRACRRWIMVICLLFVVVSGCAAQTEKGYTTAFFNGSPNVITRHVQVHVKTVSDMLDNVHWTGVDDVAAGAQIYDRKALHGRQGMFLLLLLRTLLAGITVLSVVVSAGSFYDSSSQTCGLSRIQSFILAADGEKGTGKQFAA